MAHRAGVGGQRGVQLAPQYLAQERQRARGQCHALAAAPAEHAAFVEVEGHELLLRTAAHAVLQLRADAFRGQHLPEEGRHDELGWLRRQRSQRPDQHPVEVRDWFAVRRQPVDRFEQRQALGEAVQVVPGARVGSTVSAWPTMWSSSRPW